MDINSLDYKVFGRDSVFIAAKDAQLGSWLSSIFKKATHLIKKVVNIIPGVSLLKHTGIYRVLKRYEHKHRAAIKKIGAVIATVAAGSFIGPAIGDFVGSIGGNAIAKAATASVVKDTVGTAIAKSMTPPQRARLKQRLLPMTPAQVLADPELAALSQKIAAAEAARTAPPGKKTAAAVLAVEGANEVQHAAQKKAGGQSLLTYAIPAAIITIGLIL